MKFHRIATNERHQYQPGIVAIEKVATYPLGDDYFQIDHGIDYFAFFDRLGEVKYYAALDGDAVAAVGAGILRDIPYHQGKKSQNAWYLCDLKVDPYYQKRRLSLRILSHAICENIRRCGSGYTISMNPGDGSRNRLVQIFQKFSLVKFSHTTTLGIYSLDAMTMRNIEPLLVEHRGEISYLSLKGIKDLKLQSTGNALPLLHVQWGATVDKGVLGVIPSYAHMFCVPDNDALALALAQKSIYPSATASVVSHGMESDWRFILTSDI